VKIANFGSSAIFPAEMTALAHSPVVAVAESTADIGSVNDDVVGGTDESTADVGSVDDDEVGGIDVGSVDDGEVGVGGTSTAPVDRSPPLRTSSTSVVS